MTPKDFYQLCTANGFSIVSNNTIVSIKKKFSTGDSYAFADCDSIAHAILSQVPTTKSCSSIWGTDGGSVGGYIAMTSGNYVLNISGVKKNFIKELVKIS